MIPILDWIGEVAMMSKRRNLWIGMVLVMIAMEAAAGVGGMLKPVIISVTPMSGPNEGGTMVMINGEGFNLPVRVFFGKTVLIEAEVINATSTCVLVSTPSATGGYSIFRDSIVDVTVRNEDSGQEASLTGSFKYNR